ncbi:transposase [Actinobaculum sp. 352]|uniref:transposase n=1 Tax=Actinobaculum sp. 352 TaxID=2490946 RepID=UPI000F7D7498|nr:transposase [Actinobaculum sp. 352]RTE49786.1 hypothetical protein EKN07_04490 [Actinobaculum sp. 352]
MEAVIARKEYCHECYPWKYPEELRERATRMAVEARRDPERSMGAIRRIGDELGVHLEALRTWVKKVEIDAGARSGTTTPDAERIRELEAENRELRRANEILRKASACFTQAECERRERSSIHSLMTTRRTLGPVPIFHVLTSVGVKIAPSAYRARKSRPPVPEGCATRL